MNNHLPSAATKRIALLCAGGLLVTAFQAMAYVTPADFAGATVIEMTEHGAVPNDGINDLPAVRAVIAAAQKRNVPAVIHFAPGVYIFDAEEDNTRCITIDKAANLMLDGDGAEILIKNPRMGFSTVINSDRIIISGFSIDYDPLPFTQGTIIEKNEKGFVFSVDAGFSSLDEPYFAKAEQRWGMIKDPLIQGRPKEWCETIPAKSWDKVADRRFQMRLSSGQMYRLKNISVGDKYVHLARQNGLAICTVKNSRDIRFQALHIYASPAANFVGSGSKDIYITGCSIGMKPGRWISTDADGVHMLQCENGPVVENCTFDAIADDCFNLRFGDPQYVLAKTDAKHFLLTPKESDSVPYQRYVPGDLLTVYNAKEGTLIAQAVIRSVEKQSKGYLIGVDDRIPFQSIGGKLDGDFVFSSRLCTAGAIIRNNTFLNGNRHGILLRAHDALIESNRFENMAGIAVFCINEPSAGTKNNEGFDASGSVICGNYVSNCLMRTSFLEADYGASISVALLKFDGLASWKGQQNITIEGNTIDAWRKSAVAAFCVDGITVRSNRIGGNIDISSMIRNSEPKAVRIENASHVQEADNRYIR